MPDKITYPSFSLMLDINDPDFVEDLRRALGLEEGEAVTFVTLKFERTEGRVVTYFPRTVEEFAVLKMLHPDSLKKIGCQKWDGDSTQTHWLFPQEWYVCIPNGLEIIDINGKIETFKRGETDDDIRFGALAYGFIQEKTSWN